MDGMEITVPRAALQLGEIDFRVQDLDALLDITVRH